MISTVPALNLALASVALLGLRHGLDYDHVAAITDIAGVQRSTRGAMKSGLLYALGHAATVAVLGVAVIFFPVRLPARLDGWMEHLVGVTLLVLGCCVLWTTFFQRHAHATPGQQNKHRHAPRTRVMLVVNAMLWLAWRARTTLSRKPVERYQLFEDGIGMAPALLVGVIHGLGAETPSQLMLFLLAANLGGIRNGLLGLLAFIAGMLVMNTVVCAAATGIFRVSVNHPRAFHWVAGLSAAYSILVGLVFLVGTATVATALGR